MTVGTGISIASCLASAGVALHDYLSNKGYVTFESEKCGLLIRWL